MSKGSSDKPQLWKRAERNLYLYLPTKIYYTRKSRKGKGRIFVSTGEKTLGGARAAAEKIRSEFVESDAPMNARGLRVRRILRAVDDELQKDFENGDRSKETRSKDGTFLGRFERAKPAPDAEGTAPTAKKTKKAKPGHIETYFGDDLLSKLDEDYFNDWVRDTGKGLNRSLLDFSKYLSIVLDYAYRKKYVGRKPTFQNPDGELQGEVKIYSVEQIQLFWKCACQELQDLIILGAENGLRPFENRKLAWAFIRVLDEGTVVRFPESVYHGKKSKGREVRVGPLSSGVLARRMAERKPESPWVFPSDKDPAKPMNRKQVSRLWRRMLETAGVTGEVHFKWLRHTFYTTALLEKRQDIAKVSEFGGTSIRTLQKHYLKADHVRTAEVSTTMTLGIDIRTKLDGESNV